MTSDHMTTVHCKNTTYLKKYALINIYHQLSSESDNKMKNKFTLWGSFVSSSPDRILEEYEIIRC